MIHTESELIAELNVILANLDTGPLSDTPYSDTSVNGDQQLELWEEPNSGWPSATVDTPQLARAILEKRKGTLAALDGAPEPEWEYRATTGNGSFVGESRTTPEHAVQALQEALDEYPIVLDEQGIKVERRPRSPWLPVDGESHE